MIPHYSRIGMRPNTGVAMHEEVRAADKEIHIALRKVTAEALEQLREIIPDSIGAENCSQIAALLSPAQYNQTEH